MRKIDTTKIVDPTSQQPFTGKSLNFLQESMLEVMGAAIKAKIGKNYSATTLYVLDRCKKTAAVIDNGYVFYGGEIFSFIGADTTAFANVPVISFQQPYDTTIDPIMFSDGVNKYVHELPQFYISDGTSGSTAYGDYDSIVFVNGAYDTLVSPADITIPSGLLKITGSEWTSPVGVKCNVKVTVECTAEVVWATNGRLGMTLNVTNDTAATNYATMGFVQDTTDSSAGKTRSQMMKCTWYITALAAGQTLSIRANNGQADNHSLKNIKINYEITY